MLSRAEAKIKIQECLKNNPIRTGVKLPIRPGETFDVYKIPIEYLVPNLANDRIAWKIREFEAINNRKLSYESEEDINYVYELIEGEHPRENDKTLRDIAQKGQQLNGVITNDGKIIDGNRRATLLRILGFKGKARDYNQSVEKFRFFETIVLSEDITDKEIMALETSLQIGEDAKVDYDPINIYIKIDNLLKVGYTENHVAEYMGLDVKDIKDRVERFKLMNDYLKFVCKEDYFTLLSGLEDHFIRANSVFKKLDNKTYSVDWSYTDLDAINFKEVAFDYMRAKYEGKEFRDNLLGGSNKGDGAFLKEKEWKDFFARHSEIVNNATLENEEDWKMLSNQFKGNLRHTRKQLESYLDDNNIGSIISAISTKVENLENLIKDKPQMDAKSVENLKKIEKRIYMIRREFE